MRKPTTSDAAKLRPSEFMRARRPQLFSDSKERSRIRLPQVVLEYQLETLTNRKQEADFEYFCRQLAEKELCPNLLPQTGPTGGGDSKVDAETYPVADSLVEVWYEGVGREAAQDRWAFAFSAKKDWLTKAKSDVRKIADTGRGYKLVYFITNQFVPDKKRADAEDELTRSLGLSVRILDRSWIVDRIFKNGREQLAVEALRLTGYEESKETVTGPRDTERQRDLEELEQQIKDPARYSGIRYQLAEDCLRAALLARNLERPRVEVEGRFDRAEAVAKSVGHRQQQLRVVYYRAWTAYWWFEDFAELNRLYDAVEALAVESDQANDLELLANLWNLLAGAIGHGFLQETEAKLDARRLTLATELDRLASDASRPNNALQARSIRLLIDLMLAVSEGREITTILQGYTEILRAAEGLGSFPAQPVLGILREMGDVVVDSPVFDGLMEEVVELTARRKSEGEAGQVLLERGLQKLKAGKRYDAIRLLGRAQIKLVMREYRHELVGALAACGSAYEAAGLLWAARANTLAAVSGAFTEFWEDGTLTRQALACVQRLVWIELQLGRVPHVLAWMELAASVAGGLGLEGKRWERFLEERQAQDIVLSVLLLRATLWDLRSLGFAPRLFSELGLGTSEMTMLYVLGHEEELRQKGAIEASEQSGDVRKFFVELRDQPVAADLASTPDFLLESRVRLTSYVLGCEIVIEAANKPQSVQLSETILGVLEALLATSLGGEILPYRSQLKITVNPSDFLQGIPAYKILLSEGTLVIEVRHPSPMVISSVGERDAFKDWLLDLVAHLIAYIAVIPDPESRLTELGRDEVGFARALGISDVAICERNLLGNAPKLRMSDWEEARNGTEFPLRREVPWDEGIGRPESEPAIEEPVVRPGEGAPPEELFGVDKLKHRDRRVLSLIDVPLWGEARWVGTFFMGSPGTERPPGLGLMFTDKEAAHEIFLGLRKELGSADTERRLRVTIVTGVDRKSPSHYSVVIRQNFTPNGKTHVLTVAQVKRMTPSNSRNLDGFLDQFKRAGKYLLSVAHVASESSQPTPLNLVIEKDDLHVRPAWQIGENDPDGFALQNDDEPIVPDGVKDPPVLKALEQLRRFRDRKEARRRS